MAGIGGNKAVCNGAVAKERNNKSIFVAEPAGVKLHVAEAHFCCMGAHAYVYACVISSHWRAVCMSHREMITNLYGVVNGEKYYNHLYEAAAMPMGETSSCGGDNRFPLCDERPRVVMPADK